MVAFLTSLLERLSPGLLTPAPISLAADPSVARVVAVRDGYTLETLDSGRPQAPSRRHVFADVESFAAYVRKHFQIAEETEILADTETIHAVNRATWHRDEISCSLALHPDFKGWAPLLGGAIKQKQLFKELLVRRHTLNAEENVLGALQQLDLTSSTEATFSLTENGNYDVVAKRQTTSSKTKVPSGFKVRCPVYLDGGIVELDIALIIESVPQDGGEPVFSLRCKNLEEVKLRAYQGEVTRLRELLGDAYLVGAGKLRIEA